MKSLQLCVADAAAARAELVSRGVDCSEPTSFGDADGSTFFGDPDGNTWAVQELKVRAGAPLIPVAARGRFGAQERAEELGPAAHRPEPQHPPSARTRCRGR